MKHTKAAINAYLTDSKHHRRVTVITMLQAGMSCYAIAKELGMSSQSVDGIKAKYVTKPKKPD